jgi:hypothetical protein
VRNIRKMNWTAYQRKDLVNRRAGGRRRINAERKGRAWKRREEIKEMLGSHCILLGSYLSRGLEVALAAYFGVHRSTICRDKAALVAEWRKDHVCPGCCAMNDIPLKTLERLARRGIDVGCTASACRRSPAIERQAPTFGEIRPKKRAKKS